MDNSVIASQATQKTNFDEYTGKLDNAGETVTLTHPYGSNILSITYSDRAPWPVTADGFGFSLVRDPTAPAGYRASAGTGSARAAQEEEVIKAALVSHQESIRRQRELGDSRVESRTIVGEIVA